MNKLIVALIAGAFTSIAVAQTAAPAPLTTKERQDAVKGTTAAGSGSSASTANTATMQKQTTAVSKEVPKATTAEKNAAIKASNKGQVNPNNTAGVGATATMQKETTAASKAAPAPAKVDFKDPNTQKALEKAATK